MTHPSDETLVDLIRRRGTEAKEEAAAAIAGLAECAADLDMHETATNLRETGDLLRSDTFSLMVMGRFKTGKSTMLNALMGGTTRPVDLGGQKGPMVVDDLPATATLTAVVYADEPSITAWNFDGTSEHWSLQRYLRESTLGSSQENVHRFSHIRQFEMGFPARLCQAGVTIFDSPGTDEHPHRTATTREATARCDAVVIMYNTTALMGQSELEWASRVVAQDTHLFTVVNRWSGRPVDDRLRGYVWDRYVHDHLDGPPWENQDLASRDIWFVDAQQARDARYAEGGDGAALAASGLPEFERRLGDFLVSERQHVHLARFTNRAATESETIERHIGQRRQAVEADQERLRRAFSDMQPQLAQIRARPKKLGKIVSRYREEAQSVLVASFAQAMALLRQDLPQHLADAELPSGEKFLPVLRQKKLAAEASEVVSAFVTERIDRWAEQDAAALMSALGDRLAGEIETEIAGIARQYDEIHLDLTGWTMDEIAVGSVVGNKERLIAAVTGLLLGDASAALTGGAGGYRGAAGGIAGAFGSGFVLTTLGVTAAPVLIPVTLATALVLGVIGGGIGFEKRVKDKVVDQTDPMLAALATGLGPKISEKIAENFALLEKTVTDDITAVIDEEERNVTEVVELNQRSQAERDRSLVQLTAAAAAVATHRAALDRALLTAKQI